MEGGAESVGPLVDPPVPPVRVGGQTIYNQNCAAAKVKSSLPMRPLTAGARNWLEPAVCLSCDAPILNADRSNMQPMQTLGGGFVYWSKPAEEKRSLPPLTRPNKGTTRGQQTTSANMQIEGVDGKYYSGDHNGLSSTKDDDTQK